MIINELLDFATLTTLTKYRIHVIVPRGGWINSEVLLKLSSYLFLWVFSQNFSNRKATTIADCYKIEEISRETAALSKIILTHCVTTFLDFITRLK